MPLSRIPPTADRVREVFAYDPETGELRWRFSNPGHRAGALAGHVDGEGYRTVGLDYQTYRAHHLVWLYIHGGMPATGQIDHRNGTRDDNRLSNLREATTAQNQQNRHRPSRINKSGFLGVSPTRAGTWVAHIRAGGKKRHLGCFFTPEEASEAYLTAKRAAHEFWSEVI